jgi:hypothetical protein
VPDRESSQFPADIGHGSGYFPQRQANTYGFDLIVNVSTVPGVPAPGVTRGEK